MSARISNETWYKIAYAILDLHAYANCLLIESLPIDRPLIYSIKDYELNVAP